LTHCNQVHLYYRYMYLHIFRNGQVKLCLVACHVRLQSITIVNSKEALGDWSDHCMKQVSVFIWRSVLRLHVMCHDHGLECIVIIFVGVKLYHYGLNHILPNICHCSNEQIPPLLSEDVIWSFIHLRHAFHVFIINISPWHKIGTERPQVTVTGFIHMRNFF
jgi:hypothetical protein